MAQILNLLFNFIIFIFLLRLLMDWSDVSRFNLIYLKIFKFTQFLLKPIRKLIPKVHGFEFAGLLLLLFIIVTKLVIVSFVLSGGFPNLIGFILWSFADLFDQLFDLLFCCLFGSVIFSWYLPKSLYPLAEVCQTITEPMLQPIRNLLPVFGTFDFSPLILLLVLKAVDSFVVEKLVLIGLNFSLT